MTWDTEVKGNLPDGKFCVHVKRDGKSYGFLMTGNKSLVPTFPSEAKARDAADKATAMLQDGKEEDDELTVVRF